MNCLFSKHWTLRTIIILNFCHHLSVILERDKKNCFKLSPEMARLLQYVKFSYSLVATIENNNISLPSLNIIIIMYVNPKQVTLET